MSTHIKVWWASLPLTTRSTAVLCTGVYLTSALVGFSDLGAVCISPAAVARLQLYRIITSAIFHAGALHLVFNMMALLQVGPCCVFLFCFVFFVIMALFWIWGPSSCFHIMIL
jgi:membrane associated rhomboid family serine protease